MPVEDDMDPQNRPTTQHRDSVTALLREALAVGLDHWIGCLALAAACDRLIDAEGGTR